MCGIYCVYKQSRSCQLPFCASPIFHFEIGDFSVYICKGRVSHFFRWKYCVATCVCPRQKRSTVKGNTGLWIESHWRNSLAPVPNANMS